MGPDDELQAATGVVQAAEASAVLRPDVCAFFDDATFTVSYVVRDPGSRACAVIDSVLDYDPASGRTGTRSAARLRDHVVAAGLEVAWHLETHAHADHLSAAPWLKAQLGGRIAIGCEITRVQETFGDLFNLAPGSLAGGFDHLFGDGEAFRIGGLDGRTLHVPGHTPADVAYVIGDAAFVGDTLFMPDYGTARADFPGGDARALYRSIRRLLALPPATRLFLCHDYKAPGRDAYAWETTVADERAGNVHVRDGVSEAEFVALRRARDATLQMPTLLLPAVQANIRGGRLPEPEANGVAYFKIPLNAV